MKFTKMQGSGNDFIVVKSDDTKRDWSRLAMAMSDRHFGIGSDGLVLVLPSDKADFRMRMFDPDGSEAEACGNGIMCLAKFVFEEGLLRAGADEITVETIAGIRKLKLIKNQGKATTIEVGMGEPRFGPDDIPVALGQGKERLVYIKSMMRYPVHLDGWDLELNLVSMGNPHAVYFSPQVPSDFPLSQLGPKVEHLEIFPRRTNFEVARVLSREEIEVRVWERGVGETLACGSGACAVAVAAQLYGYVENKVNIRLPGGTLQIEWPGSGEVLMRGPAERVFIGEWPE
jgi:diaminopimelate epimerase